MIYQPQDQRSSLEWYGSKEEEGEGEEEGEKGCHGSSVEAAWAVGTSIKRFKHHRYRNLHNYVHMTYVWSIDACKRINRWARCDSFILLLLSSIFKSMCTSSQITLSLLSHPPNNHTTTIFFSLSLSYGHTTYITWYPPSIKSKLVFSTCG